MHIISVTKFPFLKQSIGDYSEHSPPSMAFCNTTIICLVMCACVCPSADDE